jgi:ArsR family transcriptional regulator, arsenate/arsenite/antimonite-responsive transcriptional repressor
MKYGSAEYALAFKALSDETRLKIIEMLGHGELCACKILESFNITQPTLSYHMKILTESGLVSGCREGAWTHYTLNKERIAELIGKLSDIQSQTAESTESCCNGE